MLCPLDSNALASTLAKSLKLCTILTLFGSSFAMAQEANNGHPFANTQPEQIISDIENKLHSPEYMASINANAHNLGAARGSQNFYESITAPGISEELGTTNPDSGEYVAKGSHSDANNKHGSLLSIPQIKDLTGKCEGKHDLEACQKLGVHYSTLAIDFNQDIEINMRLAAFNLEKACVGGLKSSCLIWGHALGMYGNYFIDDMSPKKDYAYGFSLLNHACQLEDTFGCAKTGLLYYYGRGVEQNRKNSLLFFNKSCELAEAKPTHIKKIEPNLGLGCYYAGKTTASNANYTSADPSTMPKESIYYFQRGCNLNSPDACLELSSYYTAAKDSQKAIYYSQRTCLAGNSQACFENALQLHEMGDDSTANRFLDIGCQMGNGDSCTLLATNMLSGVAIKQDTKTAIMMLESACKANNGLACMYLGQLCITGGSEIPNYSTPINLNYAGVYFERACSLGVSAACQELNQIKTQQQSLQY